MRQRSRQGAATSSPLASPKAGGEVSRAELGLRERKKARTRAAIQRHALRLFKRQGYDETTIEQIAEAAEVSPATVYRYYPTKEDLVLQDDYDPLFIEAFNAQPPDVSPIEAIRRAFREVFGRVPPEELATQVERFTLIQQEPDLRAHMLEQFTRNVQLMAEVVAARAGRRPDEIAVRAFAGAVIGASVGALFAPMDKPASFDAADYLRVFDECLAFLEAGLPL